jgi:hypothetical protein
MWNVVVLLLMHLLGAADYVVASYVFVIKSSIISKRPSSWAWWGDAGVFCWGSSDRELRVGLLPGNCCFMYRACVGALVRVTGRSFCPGMTVPTDEPLV